MRAVKLDLCIRHVTFVVAINPFLIFKISRTISSSIFEMIKIAHNPLLLPVGNLWVDDR